MHDILSAFDLRKQYKGRVVVHDMSLTLASGEIVGLLGPNGAGKTTTFYMIAGIIATENGRIVQNQRDITALSFSARASCGIGYLPQEPSVFRGLSVRDNIFAACAQNRALSTKEQRARCESLLEDFQLTTVCNVLGMQLSGGERRRAEIARALALTPKFILLDEPFAGVDPISVGDIQQLITTLSKKHGVGVFITDHNVRETLGICDRAYIMNNGSLVAEGAPAVLLKNPRVRAEYLGENFRV